MPSSMPADLHSAGVPPNQVCLPAQACRLPCCSVSTGVAACINEKMRTYRLKEDEPSGNITRYIAPEVLQCLGLDCLDSYAEEGPCMPAVMKQLLAMSLLPALPVKHA